MFRALVRLGLASALVLGWCSLAQAEPRPLGEVRSDRYYYLHSGLTLGAFLGTGVQAILTTHHGAGYDLSPFGPDDAVRNNFSAAAANLSDKLLAVTASAPLMLQMSQGFNTSMGNASVVYAEAHAFNLLLTDTVKLIVRRPRPFTHARDPRILAFIDRQGSDAFSSFFSGHSSAAFTSAMAGSLLYAARTDDLGARHVVWGFEFLLAGMTAQLRVSAGRHYRTDIWVGSLAGLAMGFVVPALHGVEVQRVRPSEIATAGGAFAVSMLLSEVVNFCKALDTLHLCALPRDISVPLQDARRSVPSPSWVIAPAPVPGGAGFLVSGQL